MKYAKLKKEWCLRGWNKLPYGIVNHKTGQSSLLTAEVFQAVSACDGIFPFDSVLLSKKQRQWITELVKKNIVEIFDEPSQLESYQEYRLSKARYIRKFHWSITGKCNLKCKHCFLSADVGKYGELSTQECFNIIDELVEANVPSVSITGGEPLVRKDFWQIVDYLLEKKIAITQIYTNGLLVTDTFLAGLKKREMKCELILSFDGCGWHDWLRGVVGVEKKTIEVMKRIVKHGVPLSVETALHQKNIGSLLDTYQLLKEIGVSWWKTSVTIETGNWKNDVHEQLDTKVLYDEYLKLIPLYLKDNSPMDIMLGGFFNCGKNSSAYTIPFEKIRGGDDKSLDCLICQSARVDIYALPTGKILPCIPMAGTYLEEKMPSLKTQKLTEILSESGYLEFINKTIRELAVENDCSNCQYLLKCGCGCLAQSIHLAENGAKIGKDKDACFFWHNQYDKLIAEAIAK